MKPSDFLIGVFDFFAILLPGSIATWLVVQYIPSAFLREALSFRLGSQPDAVVLGTAFVLSSYMLGHFVFMMGAELDPSYDRWRRRTKPPGNDKTYQAAKKVQKAVNKELMDGAFTTLRWAKAYIQIKASGARGEIDRLEADQKFFRSLVVVSTALAAHFFLREAAPIAGVTAIAMAVLSYRRYVDQRWKATELTYATAVIVYKALATGASAASQLASEEQI
jgi:hypothetical protein